MVFQTNISAQKTEFGKFNLSCNPEFRRLGHSNHTQKENYYFKWRQELGALLV